jgi:hypothetical protein
VYLLQTDALSTAGMIERREPAVSVDIHLRVCTGATYSVAAWDTREGEALARTIHAGSRDGMTYSTPPFLGDITLAIRRVD